jgi:hypothetical protein
METVYSNTRYSYLSGDQISNGQTDKIESVDGRQVGLLTTCKFSGYRYNKSTTKQCKYFKNKSNCKRPTDTGNKCYWYREELDHCQCLDEKE